MDLGKKNQVVTFIQQNKVKIMIQKIQAILKYNFKDEQLLIKAITHGSIDSRVDANYERLEFLGDRVLGMAVASLLYHIFPKEPEGNLSQRFVGLVCKETVSQVALTLHLDKYIKVLSKDLRRNENVLCDVMEAVIGAIYIDGGDEAAIAFVNNHWRELIDRNVAPPKDAKTALQEYTHHHGGETPVYELIDHKGSEHEPIFTVAVHWQKHIAQGVGRNKKQAEFTAAKALLEQLQNGK